MPIIYDDNSRTQYAEELRLRQTLHCLRGENERLRRHVYGSNRSSCSCSSSSLSEEKKIHDDDVSKRQHDELKRNYEKVQFENRSLRKESEEKKINGDDARKNQYDELKRNYEKVQLENQLFRKESKKMNKLLDNGRSKFQELLDEYNILEKALRQAQEDHDELIESRRSDGWNSIARPTEVVHKTIEFDGYLKSETPKNDCTDIHTGLREDINFAQRIEEENKIKRNSMKMGFGVHPRGDASGSICAIESEEDRISDIESGSKIVCDANVNVNHFKLLSTDNGTKETVNIEDHNGDQTGIVQRNRKKCENGNERIFERGFMQKDASKNTEDANQKGCQINNLTRGRCIKNEKGDNQLHTNVELSSSQNQKSQARAGMNMFASLVNNVYNTGCRIASTFSPTSVSDCKSPDQSKSPTASLVSQPSDTTFLPRIDSNIRLDVSNTPLLDTYKMHTDVVDKKLCRDTLGLAEVVNSEKHKMNDALVTPLPDANEKDNQHDQGKRRRHSYDYDSSSFTSHAIKRVCRDGSRSNV